MTSQTITSGDYCRFSTQSTLDAFADPLVASAAEAIVLAHPCGAQYLADAPVIALAALAARRRGDTEVSIRMLAAIRRGAKLREVMREGGVAYGTRRLCASVLRAKRWLVVRRLCLVPRSQLAKLIPVEAADQETWLQAMMSWCTPSAPLRQIG